MHYNLLFNGCSIMNGDELQGINDDFEYQRVNRFSHVIGELTGLTYCNISESGSCDDRILRTTMEWFEEGNTCDHAIILWSFRNRVDYFSEQVLRDHHTTSRYYNMYPSRKVNRKGKPILRSLIEIQNDSNDQNNEDRCMYWMEQLLKDKCSFDYLKPEKESEVGDLYYQLSPYYKHRTKFPITYIYGDILLLPKDKLFYFCKNIPGYPKLNGGHPNELGHRKIADYIINNFDYFQ